MNLRTLPALLALLTPACASLNEPARPLASTTSLSASAASAAAPGPASARGTIVGHVATNPWHDIKAGGVVYLEDGPKDNGVTSATLDNHDMTFVPSLVTVSAGGSVIFTNTDPMTHNVFTTDGDKWDLGQIPQYSSVTRRFDTPGNSVVLCNLHQNMRAYLAVLPSNYFARTDADGGYVIKNVPPGTYHVTAWSPRLKAVTQAVTVSGAEVTANFNLER